MAELNNKTLIIFEILKKLVKNEKFTHQTQSF